MTDTMPGLSGPTTKPPPDATEPDFHEASVSPETPTPTPTRRNSVLVAVLAVLTVVFVAVGIFGFTRPPSTDAKRQGDALAKQIATVKASEKALDAKTAQIRATVAELQALDSKEADAANAVIDATNEAADRWNAGDTTAFASPSLTRAVTSFKSIVQQERTLLTKFKREIAQAQEAQ